MEKRLTAKEQTKQHIIEVHNILEIFITELKVRQVMHDASKLKSPEVEVFDIYTEKLKGTTYGSEEYKKYLKEMKPALDHHYANNRHHPEHFIEGVNGMDLFDLCEMISDWSAATKRHADGDLYKSLEINKERFLLSNQLYSILYNTIKRLEILENNGRHSRKEI